MSEVDFNIFPNIDSWYLSNNELAIFPPTRLILSLIDWILLWSDSLILFLVYGCILSTTLEVISNPWFINYPPCKKPTSVLTIGLTDL